MKYKFKNSLKLPLSGSLAILLSFLPLYALAQASQGVISGTVNDLSGAVIPNATVTAQNIGTGIVANTTTSAVGTYRFPNLNLGAYTVTVTAPGFKTEVRKGVVVQINSTATVDVRLSTGEVSETIQVNADAPTVETQTSDIGNVVTPRQVVDLPLSLGGVGAFRSPEAFVFLTPGTTGPGTAGSSNGIYLNKISGSQNFGNEVLLDGASAVRADNGSTFDETSPSVEAIQEFKVTTGTPGAQFGRTTGGIESFATKSGSNQFHGSAYDILRNTVLDANTWFNNANRARCSNGDAECRSRFATPKDIKNDFGVSFGGPVLLPHIYNGRDKTFFFFTWEQLRWPRSATTTSTLPTEAQRTGDFSSLLTTNQIGTNPCNGDPVYAGQIFDPSTTRTVNGIQCRTAFPGNRFTVVNPVALKVLTYLPQPNLSGAQNNFAYRTSFPTTNTTYTIRVDQTLGNKDKIFASYHTRENTLLTGGTPVLPGPVDPNTWNQDFTTHYVRVGWDHTFSANLLNHLNASYNRTNSKNNSLAVNGTNWGSELGVGGVSGRTFPRFNLNESFPAIGQQRGDDDIGNQVTVSNTVTLVKGRHQLTLGGEARFYQYNDLAYDAQSGTYNFSRAQTAASNANGIFTSQGGNSFASFLLGSVDNANLTSFAHYPRYTSWYNALFLQDDYRLTKNLTVNLGLRWDVDTPRHEAQNYTSNFNPTLPNPSAGNRPGALEFASNCGKCNGRWADTYYKDFGPRVGFAWSPYSSGKTAIRGGYSIVYGPLLYSDFGNSMVAGYAATPNPVSPDGFNPAFNLRNGFPSYAQAPTLNPGLNSGNHQSVDYIKPEYGKPPMIQMWSLQVQQELAPDLILSVAYVGNHGTRLHTAAGFGNINDIRPSSLAFGSLLNADINSPQARAAGVSAPFPTYTGNVGDALRPFPQYGRVNADCCLENDGQSTFHALEVALQRRFRNGLNLLASYTWSKTLNNSDSLLPGQNGGGGLYQNPFNLKEEKARSSQDIPHTFVISYIYELPFGKDKMFFHQGKLLNEIVGGWQVGGIQRYQSGQPLPFYCAGGIPGWDNCIRFNPAPGQTVYSAAKQNGNFDPLVSPYLNKSFFVDPNASRGNGPYRLGSLPRVTGFRMQSYLQEDFSLIKRFHIREAINLQLRAETFNAFNRHVFSTPFDLGPNDPQFGVINSTVDTPRQLQVTARFDF